MKHYVEAAGHVFSWELAPASAGYPRELRVSLEAGPPLDAAGRDAVLAGVAAGLERLGVVSWEEEGEPS